MQAAQPLQPSQRTMVRRLEAICAHKHLDLDELAARRRLRLCFRVPKLTSGQELQAVAAELAAHPAALVVLDPLYLAVAGAASGADLYAMEAVLSGIQGVCQRAGAALVVVTHWNKTGEGRGAKRISGVGPGAWGRVLASAGVANRTSTPDGASTVVLAVEVIGGELADVASPLHYAVEVLAEDPGEDGPAADLKPSRRWVLAALRDGGAMQTVAQLGDRTAADGHQLRARTIQEALNDLEAAGLAAGTDPGAGLARYWSPTTPDRPPVDGMDGGGR
jgi:AAA domain-containing protein